MRLRRCVHLMVELDQEPRFEFSSLLSGGDGLDDSPRWLAYAPHLTTPAAIGLAALGVLAIVGTLGPVMLVAWLAAFGFVAAYGPVLIAHGRSLFLPHQVGRGLTVLNMGQMGGTFLAQAISGFVIGVFPVAADGAYSLAGYRLVFGLQAVVILLACLVYFGSRDPMRAAGCAPRA